MNEIKPFIKLLNSVEHSKSPQRKFLDFCETAYCAHAKLTAPTEERADALEERYMRIVGTYRDKDVIRNAFPELLKQAVHGVWQGLDYLGVIASEIGVLNAKQGQYFTPIHVSRMMAKITLGDLKPMVERQGFITMSDPCCGAGSMILAAADEVYQQGLIPELHMLVHAVDINPLCYQMCFLQLTWKGVSAYVEHGNSLSLEHFEGAWTPPSLMFLARHGHLFPEGMKRNPDLLPEENIRKAPDEAYEVPMKQLSLFDVE